MKKSILIVDDDKSTCRSIAKALSNDYKIHTAFNGHEALKILDRNNEIQIVLTDVVMPEMNGLELLEKIHLKNNRKIVIMITGYTELESTIEARNLGAYDYLMKPVDLNKLEVSIKNAFEKIASS
jgi:DNA-binding NtrC family response regulator